MLFTQLWDGEAAPQGYCAATTKNQAGLLFKEMKRMIKRSPLLKQFMDVSRGAIETARTDGLIACLSRDGDSSDGINPSFLARDEMHRWTDRELADTIVESMIARAQPIDWVITTAGQDRGSLCGELRDYGESVLRDAVKDDSFFGFIAEPPADCDPADPQFWAMGNPNLGVSKKIDAMQSTLKKALAIAGRMPNFKRFHLNLWTEGAATWIDRDIWDKASLLVERHLAFRDYLVAHPNVAKEYSALKERLATGDFPCWEGCLDRKDLFTSRAEPLVVNLF